MAMAGNLLADISGTAFSADDVLSPYIYIFYVAFLVAIIFTPIMRTVAVYYGIIDQPDSKRKLHRTPVAYLGGVAVFLGWIAGLAISQFVHLHRQEPGWPPSLLIPFNIIVGACLIVLLGLWDDIFKVSPRVKIIGQIAAAIFLLADNIGTHLTAPLLMPLGERLQVLFNWPAPGLAFFPPWLVVGSSSLLVIFLVVACCNATNLMDGLDGLCGGVTAIIAGGFLFLAVNLAMNGAAINTNWDGLRIALALALLGGVLGFVPYNFNPASIFMGDTGSMFLGYCCAVMMILMGQGQHPKWFLASMVIFALPVLDTTLAFARRWVNRRPIFSADRFHFHHQLCSRGFTVKQTVLISYGLAIGFALMGVAITFLRTRIAVAIYMVIFGCIIVAAYKMGMVHERPAEGAAPKPADALRGDPGSLLQLQARDADSIDESADEPVSEELS